MQKDTLFALCALLWWVAVAFLLPGWRKKSGDPAFRMLLIALVCKAVAMVLANSAVLKGVDRRTGLPNLGILLQHLMGGLAFTAAVLAVLAHWSYPPDEARRMARSWAMTCGIASIVLVLLWALNSTELAGHSPNYLVTNADQPLGATYVLVYAVMIGLGLVETVRLCRRCARAARSIWLRLGLRLAAVGSAIYLAHPLNRAVSIVAEPFGLDPLRWEQVSLAAIGAGTVLLVSGLMLPLWAKHLSALSRWVGNYRTYRKIRPLWLAFYDVLPEIALEAPGHQLLNLRYHLYRTVIEIRDGWRAVGHNRDPDTVRLATDQGIAEGWNGLELKAYVDAKLLKAELAAHRSGQASSPSSSTGADPHLGEDFPDELRWLTKVAEAYVRV